jgi:phenylalanyl-tRNA synthetase beta chain
MKISYQWLREYVNTKLRPESIAESLTMAGHEVSSIEHLKGDDIFDIEVTANRADCLSHIGIAREVSAITGKAFKLPNSRLPKPAKISRDSSGGLKIIISDKAACPLYTYRIIKNLNVASAPKRFADRIHSIGLRPVNNIVDITNFVLFETGQPLHAFDLDKISGNEIFIRYAKLNERIVTIDGTERRLTQKTLVIADETGPIAIAGIMGGKSTEISSHTKNILLESAYFNPVSIRKASFALGLSTDSSYRFERGVDPDGVKYASDRAAALIRDAAKGSIGKWVQSGIKPPPCGDIILRTSRLNKILGTTLTSAGIKKILTRLGYKVKGHGQLTITTPPYRNDTMREADLIEEAARIYGYDNIPQSPPYVIATMHDARAKDFICKRQIARNTLTALGFNEILTYSLVGKDMIKDMPWHEDNLVNIKNPLSREQEIMRPSLIPGMVRAVSYNISRQVYDIKVFELSNVYFKSQDTYNEELYLAFSVYTRTENTREQCDAQPGLRVIKGTMEQLAEALGIKGIRFEQATSPMFQANESVAILSGHSMLGSMGVISQAALASAGITGALFAAELNLDIMMKSSALQRYYSPLPRFPFAYRDVSFSVGYTIEYEAIKALIMQAGGLIVEGVELLSEYKGKQIEKGHRGLAIRVIFRSKEKTLAEEDISASDRDIRNALRETFNAVLR